MTHPTKLTVWETHSWPRSRPLFCIFPRKEGPAEQGQMNRGGLYAGQEAPGGGAEGNLEPYRMQVTEAACWSFMLFLRSRMLSEDW